LTIADSFMP
jgi:ATP citrate (pro-S)-lyase